MSKKILIVDDEPRFLRLVSANLAAEGFEVLQASNGLDAIDLLVQESPDLLLLDIMMPKLDGLATLDRIREFSQVAVIMLTAKGKEADRVEGLNRGADDYIVKPFSAIELMARVNAVLRRSINISPEGKSNIFSHGDLIIDFAKAEITYENNPVLLSATEYRLLLQFAHNVGRIISGEELLTKVWGKEYKEDKEILWVCISRLRQKLEADPKKPIHIETRPGIGYTMPSLD